MEFKLTDSEIEKMVGCFKTALDQLGSIFQVNQNDANSSTAGQIPMLVPISVTVTAFYDAV